MKIMYSVSVLWCPPSGVPGPALQRLRELQVEARTHAELRVGSQDPWSLGQWTQAASYLGLTDILSSLAYAHCQLPSRPPSQPENYRVPQG